MLRKGEDFNGEDFNEDFSVPWFITTTLGIYLYLKDTNPKLIPYAIGAQIATNVISGIHELRRNKRKIAEEEAEVRYTARKHNIFQRAKAITKREKCYRKSDCSKCDNSKCAYYGPVEKPVKNQITITNKNFYEKYKFMKHRSLNE